MPYITKPNRERLDPAINAIVGQIRELGELNYVITRLAVLKLKAMQGEDGRLSYAQLSSIRGVLQDASDEFYWRAMRSYEDKKKELNGDVYVA